MSSTADAGPAATVRAYDKTGIPAYLERVYWWAYVRPWAIRFFERDWLVNAILFGNYRKLRDRAFALLGERLSGRTLQIACVYGDMTARLDERVRAAEGRLDVVDVVPGQIENLRRKLPQGSAVRSLRMDAAALEFPDGRYDRALLFFLLHEQPEDWRRRTLEEALRVVKPGGRIVIVDYARPEWWSPLRYMMAPTLALLEPFALDLWRTEVKAFLEAPASAHVLSRETMFSGLYQLVALER